MFVKGSIGCCVLQKSIFLIVRSRKIKKNHRGTFLEVSRFAGIEEGLIFFSSPFFLESLNLSVIVLTR